MNAVVATLSDARTAHVSATALVDEIERDLSFASLDRLATFERLGKDPDMPADAAVAIAINGCTERSSLPPKPPPQAVGTTRTASGFSRMTCAISSRSI